MSRILNILDTGGIPHMPFQALAQFARDYPKQAVALLGTEGVAPEQFGRRLLLRFDRLVRDGCRNRALLSTLAACERVLNTDARQAFLHAVAADAERASKTRAAVGRVRSLWGTTPILNIVSSAKADRLLGVEADTVVVTAYHITRDFDLVLKEQQEWVLASAPELYYAYFWMVFLWALVAYDVFFYFNDRGIVLPAGGYGSDRFGISLDEMRLLKQANKRFYTLAYGADYRVREKTLASGKFNFCMHCPEIGKFCLCDDAGGTRVLETIGSFATAVLGTGLSLDYLPNPRNLDYLILDVRRIKPHYPWPHSGRPLRVVHAPNHPPFKGTHYLEATIKRLQDEGQLIELVMISGVSNREVLNVMRGADLVVEQLIGGSFGLTALEGMALGKPVLCYVKDPSRVADPAAFPIINANPDTLYDTLRKLLADPTVLADIGRRSRAYVERHHSIESFAQRLRTLYLETGAFAPKAKKLLSGNLPTRAARGVLWLLNRRLDQGSLAARGIARRIFRSAILINSASTRVINSLEHRFLQMLFVSAGWIWSAAGLPVVIRLARIATARRMRKGMPSSLWGVTPILTLPLLARCDRELGLGSESLVYTTYHIRGEFDINLKRISDWLLAHFSYLYLPFTWLVFAYALLRFDIFNVFCDRGILLPAGRMGINPRELDILQRARKRIYTFTYGADVRTRARTLALGEFNFCMHCPEPGKFCICDDPAGFANIDAIEKYATAMLAMGDMIAYVPHCQNFHFWPLDTRSVAYVGVEAVRRRPLRVAHATNHSFFKGTSYLEDAISRLQSEGCAIELLRIQGVPNSKVLRLFAAADVVAEQFIGGFHGYTALEAMAVGKPVICYVRSADLLIDPDACPIINTTPESLYQVLRDILADKYDLVTLGHRGRFYVEKFYSIEAVAARLGRLYLGTADLPERIEHVIEANVTRLEGLLSAVPSNPGAARKAGRGCRA